MNAMRPIVLLVAALAGAPALAQTAPAATRPAAANPADDLKALREQLRGDKKLVVAANMDLTEAEAKSFWPLYEEYQVRLNKINDRLAMLIVAYAKEYKADTLTDAKATSLLGQMIAVEEDEVRLKRAFVPKLAKVLPGRKVARYIQVEDKVRAIVKIELASEVPLAR